MNSIDVADDVNVSLQLPRRPAVSEFNYAGIITSQKDIRTFCYPSHKHGCFHPLVDSG
jgi:hypothetical protein